MPWARVLNELHCFDHILDLDHVLFNLGAFGFKKAFVFAPTEYHSVYWTPIQNGSGSGSVQVRFDRPVYAIFQAGSFATRLRWPTNEWKFHINRSTCKFHVLYIGGLDMWSCTATIEAQERYQPMHIHVYTRILYLRETYVNSHLDLNIL